MMYREVRGLHQAAYVLAFFAFGSQLLALVRDRMLAHQFGAGAELDIYYTAFRIPDLLYVLFASTLSVYVLIPFVSQRLQGKNGEEGAQRLLAQVFSVFLVLYSALALLIGLCAPYIAVVAFPGLEGLHEEVVLLMRILLLQPLLLGVSSLFGVVTQLGHRFVLYAISPLLYNIGIIVGIVGFYPIFGISGLAYGVVLGAVGHMLVQYPLVRSSAFAFGFTLRIRWSVIKDVLAVSVPRAMTLAMHQVVLLVLVSIAGLMTVGSVAVFQFAYNLQSVPLAVIGASYSIAAFPLLSTLFAEKKMDAFRLHINTALRHIIFWSVPAIALIVVLRAQMVRVVLGSGAFDWGDTRLTAAVLALLCVSLFAQAANLLLVRAFYAGGYTRIPFLVTFFGSVLAIVATVSLYFYTSQHPEVLTAVATFMRLEGVPGAEVLVLALGYSVAIIVQSLVLLVAASHKFQMQIASLALHFGKAVVAAVCGGASAYVALNFFVFGINEEAALGILIQGFSGGVVGILGSAAAYYVLRTPEMTEIYKSFHGRLFKTDVVATQDEII